MLSKKEIKDIQSLSQKKYREGLKLFPAEGPKIISELMELIPEQIIKVYAIHDWISHHSEEARRFPTIEVSGIELQKLSQLQTAHEVVAIVKQFETEEPIADSFVLYLDTIQDPGNFGTIIRIADWFGIRNIVCNHGCADLYNSKVIQASMGSIARVKIYYDEKEEWLKKQSLPVYAASLHGESLYQHQKTDSGILIIGNESRGISKELMEMATDKITIPKKGGAESLNAAVATGILLSHLLN
ncbi:MAG: TrmH family RNA methyltransferase [Flavisolibacter sp.]